MLHLYEKYGYFKEGLETITLKGVEGAEKINQIMENVRNNPPKALGDYEVIAFRDYEKDQVLNLNTGAITSTNLPKSNVLYFELSNDAWVCVRPSGTEPKIKFYIGVKGSNFEDASNKLESLRAPLLKLAE